MGKKIFLLLIILVLTPFYHVTLISGNSTTASFTPLSHTITIEMTKYGSYNYTGEIDVSKNTTYTIIFVPNNIFVYSNY